jgi:Flp pilus assembly protein CpaB
MRASTLFGIAIALFLGAGAVAAVRYTGVLERNPVIPEKLEPVMVLVAKTTIFENTTVTPNEVILREATLAERRDMKDNPKKYSSLLSPSTEAATLRIAARNIAVGELLKQEDFQDPMIPDPPSKRLEPGMRSVNVVLPKERAAGGLIRVGEYVDVFMTTAICTDLKCASYRTATAPLALGLKVVIKRDSLWTIMQADPENKPVSFTLQANAYRAALIEMAKTKGLITLVPAGRNGKDQTAPSAARLEDARAAAFLAGEVVVSDEDLQRIFSLRPVQTPEPPLATEHYNGIQYVGTKVHAQPNRNAGTPMAYSFRIPGQVGASAPTGGFQFTSQTDPDCPTCGKNAQK